MNAERTADWIQTYTGRQFWPLDPRPGDVDLADIAHALALMCRFTGHCRHFYSVAQHSVLVSQLVEEMWLQKPEADRGPFFDQHRVDLAMWGLLHDASEAYLHDLPRPLKRDPEFGALYKKHEHRLMLVLCDHFGMDALEPPIVKTADTILLLTEQRDLMGRQARPWQDQAEPLPAIIEPWDSALAEHEFLCRFHELKEARRG